MRSSAAMRLTPLAISIVALSLACESKPPAQQREQRAPTEQPPATPAASMPPPKAPPPSRACENLAFFDIYRQAGTIAEESAYEITLDLRFDLHSADCGAPDSYGHDTRLVLQLRAEGQRCQVVSAQAVHSAFGDERYRDQRGEWRTTYAPDGNDDLAKMRVEQLVLRSLPAGEAIRLERTDYYFFEGVKPGQALAAGLRTDSSPRGPAYGYTSSASARWFTTYWLSPLTFSSDISADKEQLDEYNRWSTTNRLRNSLPNLVERTFLSREDGGEVATKLSGGTPPMAATITYDRKLLPADPSADPSSFERRSLQFSRKPCDDCPSGATGWWLWSATTEWHCATDDGKLERSSYRCGSWNQVHLSTPHQNSTTRPAD